MRCIHGACALAILVSLSACSGVQQALTVACNVDGVVVPIAQPVVATLGSGGATAARVDSLLVHPAVLAACQQRGGMPATAAPVSVAEANPPVPAP